MYGAPCFLVQVHREVVQVPLTRPPACRGASVKYFPFGVYTRPKTSTYSVFNSALLYDDRFVRAVTKRHLVFRPATKSSSASLDCNCDAAWETLPRKLSCRLSSVNSAYRHEPGFAQAESAGQSHTRYIVGIYFDSHCDSHDYPAQFRVTYPGEINPSCSSFSMERKRRRSVGNSTLCQHARHGIGENVV